MELEKLSIEIEKLKGVLDLLSQLFEVRTAFLNNINPEIYGKEIAGRNGDFQKYCTIIQTELKSRCQACDKAMFNIASKSRKPHLYRCYNGLYEMFQPLWVEGILIGYLHFGQVRSEEKFNTIESECNLSGHSQIELLKSEYNRMKPISRTKLEKMCMLFSLVADQILKDKVIKFKQERPEYFLKKYVHENISKEITVASAAAYIGRSESFVTHAFKDFYGLSFGVYVKKTRIDRAKELLKEQTINQVWPQCGFKNRYHFGRTFKNEVGMTPKQYQLSEQMGAI